MIENRHLGLIDYAKATAEQLHAFNEVRQGLANAIILSCQHPSVATYGRSMKADLENYSVPPGHAHYVTDRGGKTVLHGPGQVVIYPIVSLRRYGLTVRSFVRLLEDVMVESLNEIGICAYHSKEAGRSTGVWVNNGASVDKIGFVGIRVSHGISRHGLALNVNNDLEPFSLIDPCGIQHCPVTSVKNQGLCVGTTTLQTLLIRALGTRLHEFGGETTRLFESPASIKVSV